MRRMREKRSLIWLALVSSLAGLSTGTARQVVSGNTPGPPPRLPVLVTFPECGSTVLLPVRVNGREPRLFILDSGANSIALDHGFADSIGLRPTGSAPARERGRDPCRIAGIHGTRSSSQSPVSRSDRTTRSRSTSRISPASWAFRLQAFSAPISSAASPSRSITTQIRAPARPGPILSARRRRDDPAHVRARCTPRHRAPHGPRTARANEAAAGGQRVRGRGG